MGDLLLDSAGTNMLWVCVSADHHFGTFVARQLTDDTGRILDDTFPVVSTVENVSNNRFGKITWGGPMCQTIMQMRGFPTWVHKIQHTMMASSPQSAAAQQAATTYPMGTIFIGTGKSQNIWIINKHNSTDISLLWDGKQSRFCGSESERTDRLATPRTPDDIHSALDFINKNFGKNYKTINGSVPMWAISLMYGQSAPQAKSPGRAPVATGMSPAVQSAMVKAHILAEPQAAPKKKVVTAKEVCHHSMKSYVGFTDIYDYCEICDLKVRAKQ